MAGLKETLLKETPKIKEFGSGLTAALWNIPGYQKKYALLGSPLGSIHTKIKIHGEEKKIPEGTAHFLEHKLFADKESGNVFDYFASFGASCNAYTSLTGTSYLFSTSENLSKCLELLLDFVQNLHMTPTSIQKEKKVILQEISMYKDHPGWQVFYNLLQNLYHQHPIRNDIAGTKESVLSIGEEILKFCHDTFYHPKSLLLAVIGDLDMEEIIETIEKNQERKTFLPAAEFDFVNLDEPQEIRQKETRVKFSIGQPIIQLGFKINDNPSGGKPLLERDLAFALLSDILFGTGSPAFYEMYDEGLIDDGFSAGFSGEETFGHFILGGGTNHPEKLIERLLEIIKKAKTEGISEGDLERAKKKIWGGFIASLNSLEVLAGQFVKDYRRGLEIVDHFSSLEGINKGQLEYLLTEQLEEEKASISIVEPK